VYDFLFFIDYVLFCGDVFIYVLRIINFI